NPAVGTQSITYSVGVAPCDATITQTITVDISGTATWNPPANVCDSDGPIDLTSLVTGTAGGTWSGTGVTGTTFDPSFGTQTITYTVGTGVCQDVSAQAINVTPSPDPSWTPITLCSSSAPVNLTSQVTGTPGGTWSGTGISGNVFDPFFGTQSITYTAVSGTCTASSTQTITVVNPVVATSGNPVSCFGLTDG